MINLEEFLGSTATKDAQLQYAIGGTVVPGSMAQFTTIEQDNLQLKGNVSFSILGQSYTVQGQLEVKVTDQTNNTGIVGFALDPNPAFMTKTVTFMVDPHNSSKLIFTSTGVQFNGDLINDIEEAVLISVIPLTYFFIQKVPGSGSDESNTEIYAGSDANTGLAATLVPATS